VTTAGSVTADDRSIKHASSTAGCNAFFVAVVVSVAPTNRFGLLMSSQSPSTALQSQPSGNQASPLTSTHGRFSNPSSTQRLVRRRSLRLPSRPVDIPIPPSLLQSPYLNSPESIFQRNLPSPRQPSEEDEQWLQDTIPLSPNVRNDGEQSTRSTEVPHFVDGSKGEQPRGRNLVPRSIPHPTSPSPPLRWRYPITSTSPAWPGQSGAGAAPSVTEQGYFTTT